MRFWQSDNNSEALQMEQIDNYGVLVWLRGWAKVSVRDTIWSLITWKIPSYECFSKSK